MSTRIFNASLTLIDPISRGCHGYTHKQGEGGILEDWPARENSVYTHYLATHYLARVQYAVMPVEATRGTRGRSLSVMTGRLMIIDWQRTTGTRYINICSTLGRAWRLRSRCYESEVGSLRRRSSHIGLYTGTTYCTLSDLLYHAHYN